MERYSAERLLDDARRTLDRLHPCDLADEIVAGSVVVDTRDESVRQSEGYIASSIHIPLSLLLWRVDPNAELTDNRVNSLDGRVVLVCSDGYSSSWAGAAMVTIGFRDVADLDGGFRAWLDAGLPVARVA